MIINIQDKLFHVEPMSIFLNIVGFLALISSWADGLPAIVVAMLVFIYDVLRYPYPVIAEIKEEDDSPPPPPEQQA